MSTHTPRPPVTAALARTRLEAVIAAMKRVGAWDIARPADAAFENMGAFGTRTMPFVCWLRWVFVPRVEQTIASDGPWPQHSEVAVQATREGDTDPVVHELVSSLADFDALFESRRR